MHEQSKAAKRRFNDGSFHNRWFVGHGIDIGGKPDPLAQHTNIFRGIDSVRIWDLQDGDAQLMAGVADEAYDFVHSSHCLEHMRDVDEALHNWIRICSASVGIGQLPSFYKLHTMATKRRNDPWKKSAEDIPLRKRRP
ncbi:MAG: methyltransferase domain-containing protein, partial [Magnetococcales bacterium]|nr:methyltransferase domain-containing protein [Magnetococcales bacterium]